MAAAPVEKWRIRAGAVLGFLALVGFLLSLPIVFQSWWATFPITILLAAPLALPFAWLWSRFVSHGHLKRLWLAIAVGITAVLTVLVAAPIYYFAVATEVKPALVPLVALTNGQKKIVFQGMQHVGADRFYKGVAYDLEEALGRGYVLYYEGVANSTPENDKWFQGVVTHGADLTTAYRELGQLCGLQFQSDYLQVVSQDAVQHPGNHVVADVNTAQLRAEYDRLMRTDPAFAAAMSRPADADGGSNGLERVVNWLRRGTQSQRDLAGVVCRGFMTTAMTKSNDAAERDDLDPLILDYRNRVLADRLLSEPRQRIYVTYGAKHLPGVFALLKAADPKWRIASVKWTRTIDSPESYSANLSGVTAPQNIAASMLFHALKLGN